MKWLKTYKIFESKSSLKFIKQPTKKGAKTETYNVIKDGEVIGQIKWSSRMRGYAFLPEKQHDDEIKNFIKDLMSKRKNKTNESTEESESKEYIIQTVKEILLPISDMGHEISVATNLDYFSDIDLRTELTGIIIRVVSYTDPILKMDDEVKDEFIRMVDYLESEGFSSIEALYVRTGSSYTDLGTKHNQMKIDFNEFISMEDCELRNLLFVAKKIE